MLDHDAMSTIEENIFCFSSVPSVSSVPLCWVLTYDLSDVFEAFGDGQHAIHRANDRQFDQFAIHDDQAAAVLLERGANLARLLDGLRIRREGRMDNRELVGMDRRLAGETEARAGRSFLPQAFRIIEIEERHIEQVDSGRGGGDSDSMIALRSFRPSEVDNPLMRTMRSTCGWVLALNSGRVSPRPSSLRLRATASSMSMQTMSAPESSALR